MPTPQICINESFLLVVSRDIQLRYHLGSEIIKSSEWTTASFQLPDAASCVPVVVDFILLHTQLNFFRCSLTGNISVSMNIIHLHLRIINLLFIYDTGAVIQATIRAAYHKQRLSVRCTYQYQGLIMLLIP